MWTYSALSKVMEFERFVIELNRSPYLHLYAGAIAYLLPALEVGIALLLVFERSRRWGLYISLYLMTFFTAYIYAMLNYSYYISCACMGLFESLSWEAHLSFNMGICIACAIAIYMHDRPHPVHPANLYTR